MLGGRRWSDRQWSSKTVVEGFIEKWNSWEDGCATVFPRVRLGVPHAAGSGGGFGTFHAPISGKWKGDEIRKAYCASLCASMRARGRQSRSERGGS